MSERWDLVVVGAGAAGLLAAARAAERGRRTLLLEKNRKAGVKILMSGGTRCNITQNTDKWGIIEAFGLQGRFLHSALAALSPADLVRLFQDEGVATKVEPTGKIFPRSDKAWDVLAALLNRLKRSGAALALAEPVREIERRTTDFLVQTPRRRFQTTKLLITSGGQSYPGCGTTGDGYHWATALGHTIRAPRPALVPLTTNARWVQLLRGVTLEDVRVQVAERPNDRRPSSGRIRPLDERRGSFLFTHFGLSGPVVLDVSRVVTAPERPGELDIICDFLPALGAHQLDQQLRERMATSGKRQLAALLPPQLPRRLAEPLLQLADIPLDIRSAEVTKPQRLRLVDQIKQTRIRLSGTLGFGKAEVTAGGVSLDEVDSKTMQSKRTAGLYLAGEILDLDGPIGGYNFQAAFSTGWLAGENA